MEEGAIKTESVQELVDELMPLTQLFKHLKIVQTDSTVVEYDDTDNMRRTELVKYAGAICTDEPGERRTSVMRLLTKIDDALFLGCPGYDARTKGCDSDSMLAGLRYFAAMDRIAVLPHDAFFAMAYAKRKTMRVFHKLSEGYMDEGDLPPRGKLTACIRMDALEWHQLLPATYIPLVSMREGKMVMMTPGAPSLEFKHEDSRTVERGVVALYGALILKDPAGVFLLEE